MAWDTFFGGQYDFDVEREQELFHVMTVPC